MAQSGFTPIQIYFSTTGGNVPLAADLANGELAINTADGVLYYKDSGGAVQVLASGSSVSVSAALVATTANITLSGAQTIDGVSVVAGNRVLVKDQTLSQNNGLYVASAGAWTRSIDANSSAEIAGRIITVQSGSANGGEQFATTFKSTDTLGTTGMAWFQVALQNTAVTFTDLTTTGNMVFGNADTDTITQAASYVTGTVLRSAKADTNTLALAAYDVNGTSYTNLITLTASNTPTLALTSTGVGTINNMSIGATTASTGAFTTLSSTGNTTLGDASADTVTVNGTATFTAKPTVQLTSAATNTVTQAIRLDSQSSGTPAAGIGVGMEFAAETSAGNTEVGATIEAITTDVTSTSEDFDLVIKLMIAGAAAAEVARFKSTGLTLVTGDTYQINGVDVLSATTLGTAVVSSSLTSVGTIGTGTWQGSIISPTYGGTGVNNAARTLTINTNSGTLAFGAASKTLTINNSIALTGTDATTMTFPSTSQTLAGLGLAQTFTFAQTFRAANAVRSEAAATQDAIVLAGRAGGTGSFAVTLTPTTLTANRTITLPDGDVTIPSGTVAVLGTAQTFTAAQTFRAANAVRSEAAATQDAIVLAGRAGGTGSFAVTLTPTTLTANRTITLPDGDVTIPSGTVAVLGTAQTFTAAQTFRAASAVRSEAAATQDAVVLAGRGGGTSSYAVSLTPTTLSANRTLTLPNVTDTVAVLGTTQTFSAATTFSSTVTMSGTTTNISIGTSQTSGTLTLGGTAQTGTITLGRSTGAQTIEIGTGVNTSATKTINIGTGATGSGITNISIGPTDTIAQQNSSVQLWGICSANSSQQGENGFAVYNAPTGAYVAPASVSIDAYTSSNNAGTYAGPYLAGYINWTDTDTDVTGEANFFIKTRTDGVNGFSFLHEPVNASVFVGIAGTGNTSNINTGTFVTAIGNFAASTGLSLNSYSGGAYMTAIGAYAGFADASAGGSVSHSNSNTFVGAFSGNASTNTAFSATIGNANTCLGGYAGTILANGDAATIGDDNIIIGYEAGKLTAVSSPTTIGNDNIFIGTGAGLLSNKTIGGANICIGFAAGTNLPSATSSATVIGGSLAAETTAADGDVLIGNGSTGLLLKGTWASTVFSSLTLNADNALTLRSTGGLSFYDSEFKIVDNTDPTKVAAFDSATIATGTTRTFTFPNASGTLALLSGTQTFSGSTTFSSTFTLSGTTTNISLGTSQSSGTMTMGGTAGTGTITLGRSTGAQTLSLAGGATTSGTTKTVDIGTAGVSGSITNINIGSAVAGALGTISINEQFVIAQPTPASISTTATLTNANIQAHIINTTGTSYTVTMPLGTTLETLVAWVSVDMAYDFTIINTASGTITMAVNTGVTSLGGLTIDTGDSAQFRIRRTAANTFVLYRLS
jgi:fibronectin-binding autotransporter adhesin